MMTITDWIIAVVAAVAFGLSVFNTIRAELANQAQLEVGKPTPYSEDEYDAWASNTGQVSVAIIDIEVVWGQKKQWKKKQRQSIREGVRPTVQGAIVQKVNPGKTWNFKIKTDALRPHIKKEGLRLVCVVKKKQFVSETITPEVGE